MGDGRQQMEELLKRYTKGKFDEVESEVDANGKSTFKKRLDIKNEDERDFIAFLSMLIMVRSEQSGQTFDMGVGIPEVGKFGDLILATKTPPPKKCRFFKVKSDPEKTIGLNDLFNEESSDFDISTYFFARKDMMQSQFYLKDCENEFLLYTNSNIDMYSDIGKGSIDMQSWDRLVSIEYNQNVLQDLLDPIMNDDGLLDPYNRYKFNNIITPHLKSTINSRNVDRVCEMMIDWIMEEKPLSDVEYVMEPYYGYLTKSVVNVKKKKFHRNFSDDMKTESPNVFRLAFRRAMKKKNVTMKKLKSCLLELDDLDEIYSKDVVDFNSVIGEEEIDQFLASFTFAVSQRKSESVQDLVTNFIIEYKHEEYLGCEFYTREDIRRYITENVKQFIRVMRLWVGMRATDLKCPRFFNEKVFRKLVSNHWHPNNRFEVQNPVDSFVGRDEQLVNLHNKIRRGSTLESQTVVVHGPSGVGKTQFIRKYIQNYSKIYEENIIWIEGKSAKGIESTFKRLAIDKLKLNPKPRWGVERLVKNVYSWFAEKKCLFIFDGVPSRSVVSNFLPVLNFEGNKPFVVITSVNSDWKDFEKVELSRISVEESEKLISMLLTENSIEDDEKDSEINDD